jgi:selenocysteine-specific elongation factor
MRRYILGTAGHVDHGKTELVKALTGRDTDRLKEEKDRGISIELGFAPLRLGEDTFIGVVDVPGHERFIKNMVAGAGGIDMAMLLIAADEGVMPQTKEHLEVLKALGVASGVVVISKADLADDDMIEILRSEIAELVAGTFLEGAPVVVTSTRNGLGLEELETTLVGICKSIEERDAEGPFRLPIDRVFIKEGIGVVVTGSCYSGRISVGDGLELLPSGKRVRVREIQSFNEKRTSGRAGERLAVALQGVKAGEVTRGDVIVSPSSFEASRMLDARLEVADYEDFELKNRERVRLHHGAREVMGRVILLDRDRISSGESALVQFRLESPVVAGTGDRFVVRRYSPQRVIGGGRIIDPAPARHKRFDGGVLSDLAMLEKGDAGDKLLKAVRDAGATGIKAGEADRKQLDRLLADGRVVDIEGRILHREVLEEIAGKILELAASFQKEHPLLYGIDKEELRQRVRFNHPPAVFSKLLVKLSADHPIFIKNNRVRVGDEKMQLPDHLAHGVKAIEEEIRRAGLAFLDLDEISNLRRTHEVDPSDALQFLREENRVIKVGEHGYVHRDAIEECKSGIASIFEGRESMTVGDFKETFGLTRKHAIPLLEYMDDHKFTVRVGDARKRGPALESPGSSRRSH